MNTYLISNSESLVLSLCKEIEYIESRSKNINYSLKTCQNKILTSRLISELNKLNHNRIKILNISESMISKDFCALSFEFLLEVSKRSNCFQKHKLI